MHRIPEERVDLQAPLATFSDCHKGITLQLSALEQLPALLAPARLAHDIAVETISFFDHVVLPHHAEEESELFPAVLRACAKGAERERMDALVARLVAEHRSIEALWRGIGPKLNAVARGDASGLTDDEVAQLVSAYADHARYEEEQFLPESDAILRRGDHRLGTLALAMHMRRLPEKNGF